MLKQDKESTQRRISRRSIDKFVFDDNIERNLGKRTGKILAKKNGRDHSNGFPRLSDLHSISESIKPSQESSELPRKSNDVSNAAMDNSQQSCVLENKRDSMQLSAFKGISSIKKRPSDKITRESGNEILKMLDLVNDGGQENNKSGSHQALNKTEMFVFQQNQSNNIPRQSDRISWDRMDFAMNEQTKKGAVPSRMSLKPEERKSQGIKQTTSMELLPNQQKKSLGAPKPVKEQIKPTIAVSLPSNAAINNPLVPSSTTPVSANANATEGERTANIRPRRIEPQMIRPMYAITEKDQVESQQSSSFLSKNNQQNNAFIKKTSHADSELASSMGGSSGPIINLSDGHSAPIPMKSNIAIYQQIQQLVEKERKSDYDEGKRPREPSREQEKPRKQRMSDKEQKQKEQQKAKEEQKRKQQKRKEKNKGRNRKVYEKQSVIQTRRQKDAVILPSQLKRPQQSQTERCDNHPLHQVVEEREESANKNSYLADVNRNIRLQQNNRSEERRNNKRKGASKANKQTDQDKSLKKKSRRATSKARNVKDKKKREDEERKAKEVHINAVPTVVPLDELVDSQSCRSHHSHRMCIPPVKYWQGQRIERNKGEIVGVSFTHPFSKRDLKERFQSIKKSEVKQDSEIVQPPIQEREPVRPIEDVIGVKTSHRLAEQIKPNTYHLELQPLDQMVIEGGYFKQMQLNILEAKKNKVSIVFEDSTHKIGAKFQIAHYESFKLSNRSGTHKAFIELTILL